MSSEIKPIGIKLVELCAQNQATDGFVMEGSDLLESTLTISDDEAEQLAKKIAVMVTEYRNSGRHAPEIFLKFRKGTVLVVWSNNCGVVLRFDTEIDQVKQVIVECRSFLRQALGDFPLPKEALVTSPPAGLWSAYRPILMGILANVVSRAQAGKIIDRVMANLGVGDPVPDEKVRDVVTGVIARIPDRRKKDALLAEALEELQKLS